ncbi:MAG: hypothetical protein IJ345_02870 [Clostridia bacterium]|nr:hypothetical protein [Clostridia bacterium]
MPELKNNGLNEEPKDLKKADSEKSSGTSQIDYVAGLRGVKSKDAGDSDLAKTKSARKKLPLVVDIIITVLILAMVAGVAFGAYYLFRYFSTDYENVTVEYCFAIPCGENGAEPYEGLVHEELYYDVEDSTVYFGKIISVDATEDGSLALLTVEITANHKASQGYYLGECRIAVGSDYTLRIDGETVSGTIVELTGGK